MKVISFAAIKGGVGKTTMSYNFGEWLAGHGHKVLFIDLDHQCNLSQTYGIYQTENSVANIFSGQGDVDIIHIENKNIDIIPGYVRLDNIETNIENNTNKNMLLYMWMADNYESKNLNQYDYVIIDCHPDFSTATKNAIAVSHVILSPVTPSEHGYLAKFNIEERLDEFKKEAIDFNTRKSYVTAELKFFANKIKHNTNSSRELLAKLDEEAKKTGQDNVVAIIPDRELFNKSTLQQESLFQMEQDDKLHSKYRKFFNEIDQIFANMQKIVDETN